MFSTPTLRDIPFRVYYSPADDPLHSFYLPALAASVQYDRSAGYFRSSALAAAAAGVARLIANGGRMRLLVGAELSQDDVDAIAQGYDLRAALEPAMLLALDELHDALLRQRVEALAWLVANDRLDIKVVLPLDVYGRPIPGPAARDYYHVKKGIFTDADGNQVAFTGSVNESAQAWMGNFEEFQVSVSWETEREREALRNIYRSFDLLWSGDDPHWVAVDLPEAVRQRLISYAPAQPPEFDPLERRPKPQIADGQARAIAIPPAERLIFQYLRDAPYLPGATDLGAATAPISPWPHQLQVARSVLSRFPDRVMLCDEVGLGKTIEAGLLIRQLLLSGRVRRCLILTPASVLKQWQEELYEKFNLEIPRYDRGLLLDVRNQALGAPSASPWNDHDVLLASSHLARRRERVAELQGAEPWDLLVVDEAHHARRRDFLQPQYRPNRLLTLLNTLRDHARYRALLLMTATPMQVHPVEVWDLLMTLGLSGQWGADEANFLRFFSQLRLPFDEVDWDFTFGLVQDSLGSGGQLDPYFRQALQATLGPALAAAVEQLPSQPGARAGTLRSLPIQARPQVYELARRHTPLRRYVFRNTRPLLRSYQQQGILKEKIARRKPHICRIDFRPDEAALYQRITEYITHFYQKYEQERRGLGFIMTVYRRRLTSSFFAARRSLERRRDWLQGRLDPEDALTLDDLADVEDEDGEEGLEQDAFEYLTPAQRATFVAELDYLNDFIGELRGLSLADSKLSYLKDALERLFRQRSTVLLFTQYTDTMDYLRDHLKEVYGSRVACYSGRGGEVWNGIDWAPASKELVKTRFRSGEIQILLGTESASEGLNLQSCGILINYDMPWNPMRVEQRIGRIDRIGQEFDWVWIYNYFYRDTIEDRIYQALEDRIQWFEDVVGDLQPILAEVGEVTRKLAMLPADQQEAAFQQEIARLRSQIDEACLQALKLDEYQEARQPDGRLCSPVTLADLQAVLTQSDATRHLFQPHPELADAWVLSLDGTSAAVTFSREQFDAHPDTLQFLSYGNPLFQALLESVPEPDAADGCVARFTDAEAVPVREWYDLTGTAPAPVATLGDLKRALACTAPHSSPEAAGALFQDQVTALRKAYEERSAEFVAMQKSTLRAKARRLLVKAALVEIALGQQQELFDEAAYPTSFDENAVKGLRRYGVPWTWMLKIGFEQELRPAQNDSYWAEVKNLARDRLRERFQALTAQASALQRAWKLATA